MSSITSESLRTVPCRRYGSKTDAAAAEIDCASIPAVPDQNPQPSSSASAKVFGLPELLKDILIHLGRTSVKITPSNPAKQLFVLQRVNCSFKEMIDRTQELQELMWLSPSEAPEHYSDKEDKATFVGLTLLGRILQFWVRDHQRRPWAFSSASVQFLRQVRASQFNPTMCEEASWKRILAIPFPASRDRNYDIGMWFQVREYADGYSMAFREDVMTWDGMSLGEVYDEMRQLSESDQDRFEEVEANGWMVDDDDEWFEDMWKWRE